MKIRDFPQLELMRSGIDYSFEISCRNFKVRVRPLTNLEIIQASAAAADDFHKLPDSHKLNVSASLLNAMRQLEKASTPDVDEQPTLTMAMLEFMTPDEVNHLWKQYVRITDKVNPSFESMSVDELNALVDSLKKSSDPRSILIDLPISKLIEACCDLARGSQG